MIHTSEFWVLLLLLATVNLVATFPERNLEGRNNEHKIKYVREEVRFKRDAGSFLPDINEIDTNTTFVEDVPNYPEDLVKEILEKQGEKLNMFFWTEDEIKANDKTKRSTSSSDISPCLTLSKIAYPKAAESKNNGWKFVLQNNRSQAVKVEYCGTSKACSISYNTPSNVTSECVQNYRYQWMISVNKNGIHHEEEFKLPSGCMCMTRKT